MLAEAAALPGTTPVLRTPRDADADRKEFAQNISNQTYKEWPNEAGFDGLTEERGPLELTVRGHIPDWAAGSLYRTGPGACKVENSPKGTHYVTHWFDGFAHTHLFRIVPADEAAGAPLRVVYSSRRQAETLVSEIRAQGMRNAYSFGQRRDPCIGLFGKVMSMFQRQPQGSNGDDTPSGGHRNGVRNVWISTDASMLVEADPDTLEPVGVARQSKLHPDLKGPSSCAHAQRDPETGDLFNYNLDFGRTATYRVFRVSAATGKTDILATISDAGAKAGYMHSFFLTPSYVVLCIPVAHFGLAGLKVPWNRNILDSIEAFDATQRCKWLVVDRRGKKGLVASFDTPAAFFFHSVNAFEETSPDGSVVDLFCDVIEYPNQDVIRSFSYDVLLDRNDAAKKFWGEKNRLQTLHPRLARYRLGVAQRSYLLCLNARDLTELGRAECPFSIGLGFHGVHAPTGYL
ncbi:hypothetical protein VdG1_06607 [Verticillium dahliae VDG1]|nr:hypothetical protein VdG1_06607 [Verticillium dahliae VDG1]